MPTKRRSTTAALPDAGLNLYALTDDRKANLIEAAYAMDRLPLKWATLSLADLDQFTISDGVELMKVIVDQLQWMQTWNTQLSKKKLKDEWGPGFRWEGDDLILIRSKIRLAFASSMGWLVYNADKKWWQMGPNLQYGIRSEWVSSGEKVTGYKSVKRSQSKDILNDSHWLHLNVFADWKSSHLRQAMAKAIGQPSRTLLMYSDVVRSNVVGDTEHPLLQEVPYKCNGSGSTYFEHLHVQWVAALVESVRAGQTVVDQGQS